jgi:hypothetical protein
MVFLCRLNIGIRTDAKRLGIPNWQLIALDEEFHRVNGKNPPKSFIDLLGVVC